MPIYEYRCDDCNQIFEEWQSGFEEKEVACPVCGTPSKRIMSNTSFILKGSGWYVTDYAAKNPSAAGNNGGNGNGTGGDKAKDAKADSGKAEAKTDTAKPDTAKTDSVKKDTAPKSAATS